MSSSNSGAAPSKPHLGLPTGKFVLLPWGPFGLEEAAARIFHAFREKQTMFVQGDTAVEIAGTKQGQESLKAVSPAAFCSRLESLGQVLGLRTDNKGRQAWVPVQCSERIAKALLATKSLVEKLAPIELVSREEIATVDASGKFKLLRRGYHSDLGGVYVVGANPVPEITREEAALALCDLLSDFSFKTDSGFSRAIAALITPALVMGGLLGPYRAPLEICMANQSQSGKTYFQRCVAAIYGETATLVTAPKGGVGGLDENVATALRRGRHFIQIDNLRGELTSEFIESFLTADSSVTARTPYSPGVAIDPRRYTVMITSNQLTITEDLFNRSSVVRLVKRPKDHSFRQFTEGDLLSHIRGNQAFYLGCVFALVRFWVEAGRARTSEFRHDNRPWAQSLDWIVQNAFRTEACLPLPPLLGDYESTLEEFGFAPSKDGGFSIAGSEGIDLQPF